MCRLLCSIAIVVGAALPSAAAWAAGPEGVQLTWVREEGADRCLDEARIAARVTERLGRDPFMPGARRRIRGVVTRVDGHWRVRLEEHDGDQLVGARELPFQGPECAAIDDVSVLVIALLIDPDAALGSSPRDAPAAPAPIAPPLVFPDVVPAARFAPLAVRPPAAPLDDAPSPLRTELFARGGAGFGLTPAPVPIAAIAAGVGGRLFEGVAGMIWIPEARTADGAFAFGLTAGWLGGCLVPVRSARGSLALCGAVAAGAVHAVVRALDQYVPVSPGQRFWSAATVTPRLRLRLAGPLAFELGVDLLAPLTRYRFTAGGRSVYEAPPVGAVPFAGLGLSIP